MGVQTRVITFTGMLSSNCYHLWLQQHSEKKAANKLQWDLSAEETLALAEATIATGREAYDYVVAVHRRGTAPTFANTLQVLADYDSQAYALHSMSTFPKDVSPDKAMRDASTEASNKLNKFGVECSMRLDVFESIKRFADTSPSLEPEQQRLLERTLRDYRRNGMDLADEQRDQVKAIKEQLANLGTQYATNSNEENCTLHFTSAELVGVPDDFLESHKHADKAGTYTVNLKYPDYNGIMRNCKVSETRKKMEFEYNNRNNPENAYLLEEMIVLRDQQAQILGYKTHAHYVLETRMAKSPEVVMPFLSDLSDKLGPLWAQEEQSLLGYKQKLCEEMGEEFDNKINMWDLNILRNIETKERYTVDHEEIKQYFPLEFVTTQLLQIYQELLGLRFTEVPDPQAWHEDVRLFRVHDDTAEGPLVGEFYLDMHPREGKYSHAACFGLQPGCVAPDGKWQVPVAAGVMNFTKPTAAAPSLLQHQEVVTFFHEFGHVMHQLCSKAKYSDFAGTSVERDFVEAPSQMLENWCWTSEGLARLSGHYEDTSNKLPDELIEKLVASKVANAGGLNKRQLVLGLFDQKIHSMAKANTAAELAGVTDRILGLEMTPGTNMAASFGHLAGGYDAQYYGYMWSDVFSADMFESRFQKEGIFNLEVGKAYRECILAPGGTQDAADMLRNFLGRDPIQEPFLRSLGLEVD